MGLPAGWKVQVDPNSGRLYYYHHMNHTTQWESPIDLKAVQKNLQDPAGWTVQVDTNSGHLYYMNHTTKNNQWESPPLKELEVGDLVKVRGSELRGNVMNIAEGNYYYLITLVNEKMIHPEQFGRSDLQLVATLADQPHKKGDRVKVHWCHMWTPGTVTEALPNGKYDVKFIQPVGVQ